jgi:LPXTG-motif cell wall-anchored protein
MGKKILARVGAVVAGGALAFAAAAPAFAVQPDPININPGNVPTTAEDFDNQECDGPLEDLPENVDGWHFVVGAGGDFFTSLTLTFDTPDGEVIVFIDSDDPENPSENGDPFWSGFFGEPNTTHAWVITEAGWTLTDGEATVNEAGEQDQFQLSHTCPGVPDDKTPPPTTEPPEETTPPGETTPPEDEPKLPVTGAQFGGLLILGGGLLAAGLAMVAVRRRRNISDILEG